VEFARLQGGQLDNGRFDDCVCRVFRRFLSRARSVRVAGTATVAPESAMILKNTAINLTPAMQRKLTPGHSTTCNVVPNPRSAGQYGAHTWAALGFDPVARKGVVILSSTSKSVDNLGFHLIDPAIAITGN
jgi:hypothetical protein